jgi:hypothetical protein
MCSLLDPPEPVERPAQGRQAGFRFPVPERCHLRARTARLRGPGYRRGRSDDDDSADDHHADAVGWRRDRPFVPGPALATIERLLAQGLSCALIAQRFGVPVVAGTAICIGLETLGFDVASRAHALLSRLEAYFGVAL